MPRPRLQFRLATMLIVVTAASFVFWFSGPKPRTDFFRLDSVDCANITRTVNYYVDLGEEETLREFENLLSDRFENGSPDIDERIGWLCRILYQPNGEPLRPPGTGGFMLPYDQFPLAKWPLFPIAKSGDTYCVLARRSSIMGLPESLTDYFGYCRTNGSFRTERVPVPNGKTAIRDLNALRLSNRWLNIQWSGKRQGVSYTCSEPWIWDEILSQAQSMRE